MILLDTDVMIDVLRKYPLAISWLNELESEMIGIPGLVAMELLQGCRNREEQKLVENTLNFFSFIGQARLIVEERLMIL